MVVSHETIDQIIRVIAKHVDRATLKKIVDELKEVPGNRSFRDTVERLAEKVKERPK
jgi:hypothetical protein